MSASASAQCDITAAEPAVNTGLSSDVSQAAMMNIDQEINT
jgi:hypothetical protein